MENYFNCIYCYTNKINGKKYVGQAVNFKKRHQQHLATSYNKNKRDYNVPFHNAIRKYGIDNFEVEILKENLKTKCLLNFWECYFIDKFDLLSKNNKGYNVASGGHNGNPMAGKTDEWMEEFKRKQSEKNSGENNYWYGKKLSEEHRKHISENHALKGKHLSEETKQKLSESMKGKGKGKNSPMLGRLINRYTTEGKFVDTGYRFEFVEMGFQGSQITRCCLWYKCKQDINEYNKIQKGVPRKTIGRKNDDKRYVFIYHDDSFTDEEIQSMIKNETMDNIGQLIDRFDMEDNYIDTHYSFEFTKMGFHHGAISACCNWFACGENKDEWYKTRKSKPKKSHKNYIFKYHVED